MKRSYDSWKYTTIDNTYVHSADMSPTGRPDSTHTHILTVMRSQSHIVIQMMMQSGTQKIRLNIQTDKHTKFLAWKSNWLWDGAALCILLAITSKIGDWRVCVLCIRIENSFIAINLKLFYLCCTNNRFYFLLVSRLFIAIGSNSRRGLFCQNYRSERWHAYQTPIMGHRCVWDM